MSGNNPNREQALELKAGIFVLIGLVFIAMMAFKFGRLGQGLFQQYYPLTVTFPSADGLIKNSDVQLAGARIGYVAGKPAITAGGSGVTIDLKILASVKIPRDTTFEVSSSGLLGDKFVDITPKVDFDAKHFDASNPGEVLQAGDTVEGSSAGASLAQLQTEGEKVFEELKLEIQKLTVVTDKINTGILSTENQRNLSDTLTNLKGTSQHFNVASQDLDIVMLNAKGAVDSAKQTLGTVNAAAVDVHTAIDDAKTTLDAVRTLVNKAQTGNGLIATLLNDPRLSQDLQVFVANLREHGVLFYKNKENSPVAAPPPRLGRQF